MIHKLDGNWIGRPIPKTWALKKEMPDLPAGARAIRLAFRFCVAWIVLDHESRVMLSDGKFMPVICMHLNAHGLCIGPRDLTAADGTEFQLAWRGALSDRIAEEFNHNTTTPKKRT